MSVGIGVWRSMSLFAAFSICKVAKDAAGIAGTFSLIIDKPKKKNPFFFVDDHISLY